MDSGSLNIGSRAVPNELYSPNSEATVGYVQTGSPQPSGFAMNVGVRISRLDRYVDFVHAQSLAFDVRPRETDCQPNYYKMPWTLSYYIRLYKNGDSCNFQPYFHWQLQPSLLHDTLSHTA